MAIKALKNKLKQIDYRHYVSIAITLGIIALGILVFPNAIPRLMEACRDFALSCAYYFCELVMDVNTITPTVNDIQSYQWAPSRFQPLTLLPFTWEEFSVLWGQYWQRFASWNTVVDYFAWLGNVIYYLAQGLMIVLPLVLLGYLLLRRYLRTHNNDYDVESKALRGCKLVATYTYIPVKRWLIEYFAFSQEKSKPCFWR